MAITSDSAAWKKRGWTMLKWSTVGGLAVGFAISALSIGGGNTPSINGVAIGGWRGVWTVTAALGMAGFGFGLVGFLLFQALGIAAERR